MQSITDRIRDAIRRDKNGPTVQLLGDVIAEIERLQADAGRYRWIRQHLEPRSEQMMSGDFRPVVAARLGAGFLDTKLRRLPTQEKMAELDAAIDAALKEE